MMDWGRIRKTIPGLLSFLFIVCAAADASAGDPDRVFFTIKTEHFNIHYEDGLEHTAKLTAALAEEIHDDISVLFNWEVKKTVNVVLTDSTDSANGSASVLGRPVIRLYATAPTLESALQNHDHWLRALFVHEYTHIVHLSIHGRFADVINTVFGDTYMPNQLAPRWLIEGIAVLIETHRTSGGRIRSSLYRMYIRTAALEGTLLNLGQVSNSTREYLRGAHAYIYGAMFMEYIYQKYGMEKIVQLCHEYGSSVIPYGLNRTFKKIFGRTVHELYDEWIAFEKAAAQKARRNLEEAGVTVSKALTSDGEGKGMPLFEPGDRSLLLPIANGIQDTAVYRVYLDGRKRSGVMYSDASSRISMDRSGRIFYSRAAPFKNFYSFQDLFVIEAPGAAPRRLTYGSRARYSAVSPVGDRVAMTVNRAGTSKLLLADEQGRPLAVLIDSPEDNQVFDAAWSPDGRQVAAVVRDGISVDLVLVDAETKAVTQLTHDRFIESSPSFSDDGRYLIFTSDRSGIFNVYAWDFETEKLLQITNVLSGAFSPALSHNQKTLAFLKYSSEGYDLHTTPFEPDNAREAGPVPDKFEEPSPMPSPLNLPSRAYNPFPSLVPSYWMLNTAMDADWNVTLQATTVLSDVTGNHNFGGDLLYQTEEQTVSGRIGYSYYGIGPSVHLGLSREYLPQETGYRYNEEDKDWLQVVTRGSVSLKFPVRDVDSGHNLSVGYKILHTKPFEDPAVSLDPSGEPPVVPSQYFRAGVSLGWDYSNYTSSPLGIGAHKGRALGIDIDLYHPAFGGSQKMTSFSYHWTEYVPMPRISYHTLVLTFSGAANITAPPNQISYSVGGQSETNILDTIINNRSNGIAPLRGYPPGTFKGSRYHLLRANYRFPLWFTEAAYGTLPLFLKRIQASIFNDNALISYGELNRDDWKASVGAELSWSLLVGYYQGMTLRTGYAYGLMEGGVHEFILVISGSL